MSALVGSIRKEILKGFVFAKFSPRRPISFFHFLLSDINILLSAFFEMRAIFL